MASKRTGRTRSLSATLEGAAPPRQLPLLFDPRGSLVRPRRSSTPVQKSERLPSLDQRMSTAEVLRVVGVNRSTLFRWTKRGRFPGKHVSGGWLRSDVERWLAGNRSTALPPSASRDSTVVSP
ncbi:MAG: helix-turn-helix domain-containing protein [Gammaproteobacteria bacterium]|nr:MAG: helix-turn-helix domain-containing protein [Gammaproteobacteria bacterium]